MTDVLLDSNGEFVLDAQYGDLTAVSGIEQVLQDLRHRALTPRGSLAEDTSYGFGLVQFVNEEAAIARRLLVGGLAAELARDERLDATPSVSVRQSASETDTTEVIVTGTIDGTQVSFTETV